ncbi:MAG: ATP-dependent zinc metalloprotease FtsH [Bacteroidia bacterium]|nr:MAG: ATP-dependent zinc metalloprotease FtsH [Bacteroidia bacterium]
MSQDNLSPSSLPEKDTQNIPNQPSSTSNPSQNSSEESLQEEQKKTSDTNTTTTNTDNNPENLSEEQIRQKQFEQLKEKIFQQKKKNIPDNGGTSFYWIYGLIVAIILFLTFFNDNTFKRQIEISQTKFEDMLAHGDVTDIVIVNGKYAQIYINKDSLIHSIRYKDPNTGLPYFPDKKFRGPHFVVSIPSVEFFLNRVEKIQENAGIPKNKMTFPRSVEETNWSDHLSWIIPLAIFLLFWIFMLRRMSGGAPGGPASIFSFGRSRAQLFDKDKTPGVTFADVAGLEGAKTELKEIVDFLKNPGKYTELGAKIPKGVLLVGPPGTGKTLLAKAVAGEAQVPFFSISGSEFVEMFVGVGASRVRDLFAQAKDKAPCIIFIDEIDAIGRSRSKNISTGANDERESTLNQLLTEMDGFAANSGVIVLAATNRADILDKALLRPGRFDRHIYIEMPDVKDREEIFKVHLKRIKIDKSVNVEFLARQTPGFSGADIANICNEAALIAARKGKKLVSKEDFLDAVDRVIAGLEMKNRIITPEEKKIIAFHEAGHATVSWFLEHAAPLVKVTIVPRGKSLGAAWYLPEERHITTTEQILDEMTAALGGRAAEDVIFGKISTGAINDLEKVTKQAYAAVVYYGLNSKIGNISYYDSTGQSEFAFSKPYSEKTAEVIDEEVKKMTDMAYQRAKNILNENKEKLTQLANRLLEKEVIFKEDLEEILGKRPYEKTESIVSELQNNNTNNSN